MVGGRLLSKPWMPAIAHSLLLSHALCLDCYAPLSRWGLGYPDLQYLSFGHAATLVRIKPGFQRGGPTA